MICIDDYLMKFLIALAIGPLPNTPQWPVLPVGSYDSVTARPSGLPVADRTRTGTAVGGQHATGTEQGWRQVDGTQQG